MRRILRSSLLAVSLIGLSACASHPVQVGIYTPYNPREMMTEVHQKMTSLGYTIQRIDTLNNELIAFRPTESADDPETKEEIHIRIAPDQTGSTKMTVTSARILPATAERPIKRVTASARTNKDANSVIQMYMKPRKRTDSPT